MIETLWLIAAFLLGAIGRRVCGGAFQQWTGRDIGDLPVRLFFGLTLAIAAGLAGALWWQMAAIIPLTWIGAASGNFNSMAMGHGKDSYLHDTLGLSAHGLISGGLLALPFLTPGHVGHWWWPLIGGLSCAGTYEIGWTWNLQQGPSWVSGPTQVAELLFGGLMGVALYLAV